MADGWDMMTSLLILLGGMGASLIYAGGRLRGQYGAGALWQKLDTPDGLRQRRQRRDLGMAIVAIVSWSVFLGMNVLDPGRAPLAYLYYWLVIALMLLWLCLLAIADIRHTMRLLREYSRQRVRHSLQEYLQACTQPVTLHNTNQEEQP
ncbi:MAG: hypothetical protein HJJLKODD_01578 [Phycisphaerae bacterium]|nr:hypothetical protein [Phycisphaerae bacterium]